MPVESFWSREKKDKHHEILPDTISKLPAMRAAILGRTAEGADAAISARYTACQLRHLLKIICLYDVVSTNVTPMSSIGKGGATEAIVFRWARLKKEHCEVRRIDVFSIQQLETMSKASQLASESIRRRGWADGDMCIVRQRPFLRKTAEQRAQRSKQSKETLFELLVAVALLPNDVLCRYCNIVVSFVRYTWPTEAPEEFRMRPRNFSPDRIVSACRGGAYTAENLVASCVGCNMMKGGLAEEAARNLIGWLARHHQYQVDDQGSLRPSESRTSSVSAQDRAYIK